jgi:hypothetical protein
MDLAEFVDRNLAVLIVFVFLAAFMAATLLLTTRRDDF